MPKLIAQGAQISQAKMQEMQGHMPELRQQIMDEMARQQQPGPQK